MEVQEQHQGQEGPKEGTSCVEEGSPSISTTDLSTTDISTTNAAGEDRELCIQLSIPSAASSAIADAIITHPAPGICQFFHPNLSEQASPVIYLIVLAFGGNEG